MSKAKRLSASRGWPCSTEVRCPTHAETSPAAAYRVTSSSAPNWVIPRRSGWCTPSVPKAGTVSNWYTSKKCKLWPPRLLRVTKLSLHPRTDPSKSKTPISRHKKRFLTKPNFRKKMWKRARMHNQKNQWSLARKPKQSQLRKSLTKWRKSLRCHSDAG